MIRPEQVWLAVEPVDIRGGIDSLSQRIQNILGSLRGRAKSGTT
jgi:transposase